MFSDHLHQSREEVGQGVRRQRLFERPEDLEGPAGIVPGRARQRRLQRGLAQVLLQVEA